jgi:hypothetical protein
VPIDYAKLARQHGGVAVEEPDYSALRVMPPMLAHTPRGQVVDYAKLAAQHGGEEIANPDVGTLDEELHTPPIGIDPRLEPESMMNEAQAAEVPGTILRGMADYATMATLPTMMGGARAIVTGALRSRLGPIIQGAAVGAGGAAIAGGDIRQGAIAGALAGAAGGGAAAAKTVASEAAPDAAALLKVARSAAATSAERNAARVALQRMGWVAPEAAATETAAPIAAKAVETSAERTAPTAAKAVSRGAEVAARHKALMSFAKEIAARNPKVGEKIWIQLDEAGNPMKMLTPDQAGAAARKGLKTTWIKNLWAN